MATCINCKAQLEDGATFCESCGTKQPEQTGTVFCENCGAKLEGEATFCETCGTPVGGTEPAAPAKSTAQPKPAPKPAKPAPSPSTTFQPSATRKNWRKEEKLSAL